MCGRYASSRRPEDLVEVFEIQELPPGAQAPGEAVPTEANFNIAPTVVSPVVLARAPRLETGERLAEPVRMLRGLTWGLVPSWAKDRRSAARMINARAETLLEKPSYRKAALARRALVPADGWFEWQVLGQRTSAGKPVKQPHFIHAAGLEAAGSQGEGLVSGQGLALAGIYEFWRDPELPPRDPQAWLTTYSILTRSALPELEQIHDRMPVIVQPSLWEDWLDPQVSREPEVAQLLEATLAAGPGVELVADPVSSAVNHSTAVGPQLVQPVPAMGALP